MVNLFLAGVREIFTIIIITHYICIVFVVRLKDTCEHKAILKYYKSHTLQAHLKNTSHNALHSFEAPQLCVCVCVKYRAKVKV